MALPWSTSSVRSLCAGMERSCPNSTTRRRRHLLVLVPVLVAATSTACPAPPARRSDAARFSPPWVRSLAGPPPRSTGTLTKSTTGHLFVLGLLVLVVRVTNLRPAGHTCTCSDLPFNGPRAVKTTPHFSGKRCVAVVPGHSLALVKRIKNAAGASLNDVVVAATAGAIRAYCLYRNEKVCAG